MHLSPKSPDSWGKLLFRCLLAANIGFIVFFFYVSLSSNYAVRSDLQHVIRDLCRCAGATLLVASPLFLSINRGYAFVGLAVATVSFALSFLPTLAKASSC